MKLGRIKVAMSSMAPFDAVNTSAWIWRVQHGRLVGVRGWHSGDRNLDKIEASLPQISVMGLERGAVVGRF
ncbi:hypothetical protein Q7P35_012653 [Cladosporium inversicolor]